MERIASCSTLLSIHINTNIAQSRRGFRLPVQLLFKNHLHHVQNVYPLSTVYNIQMYNTAHSLYMWETRYTNKTQYNTEFFGSLLGCVYASHVIFLCFGYMVSYNAGGRCIQKRKIDPLPPQKCGQTIMFCIYIYRQLILDVTTHIYFIL